MSKLPTRTLSILVENHFGTLFNIAGLFSARGYNIERVTVVPEPGTSFSRMTMVVRCRPGQEDQIVKQLNKLTDVVEVEDLTESDTESHSGVVALLLRC